MSNFVSIPRTHYDALIAALRRARHIVDQEADNRPCGDAGSDYEREPIEVLKAIDTALAKASTPQPSPTAQLRGETVEIDQFIDRARRDD